MYSAAEFADYIVDKCITDGFPINNINLQKVLYCIQRTYLKKHDLAFPEDIEMRMFGPMIPDVWYKYCSFGSNSILTRKNNDTKLDSDTIKIIDPIIESKRNLLPWEKVYSHPFNGKIVPLEFIVLD